MTLIRYSQQVSNNTTASYQTDDNSNGGQYTFNDIDGSSNDCKNHTTTGKSFKYNRR